MDDRRLAFLSDEGVSHRQNEFALSGLKRWVVAVAKVVRSDVESCMNDVHL